MSSESHEERFEELSAMNDNELIAEFDRLIQSRVSPMRLSREWMIRRILTKEFGDHLHGSMLDPRD